MTANELGKLLAAVAEDDVNAEKQKNDKLEAIRNVLRNYFEVDPWTGDYTGLYDENLTAQGALDWIVEILK